MGRAKHKLGRNATCPCGSGLKFKRCHGLNGAQNKIFDNEVFSREIEKIRVKLETQEKQRKLQQGLGRPIISTECNGYRFVSVGHEVRYSTSWKTFHDFLRYFIFYKFGRFWFEQEKKKAQDKRHLLLKWHDMSLKHLRTCSTESNGIYHAKATGAIDAFLNLAYNIYLIYHHVDQRDERLVGAIVKRLKNGDQFLGALFETYVAAAFLKAGFLLDYEDERNGGTSHCEFVATHPITGKKFSVEVKAKVRSKAPPPPEHVDEFKRLGIVHKLRDALKKRADHARVVFIDVNIPDIISSTRPHGWVASALEHIDEAERSLMVNEELSPSSYVFLTNHPYHHSLEELSMGCCVVPVGFKIKDFGVGPKFSVYEQLLSARKKHVEMEGLYNSIKTHYRIPATFGGEIPEYCFGKFDEQERLMIGRSYIVPDCDGVEKVGELHDAVVDKIGKTVYGAYRLKSNKTIIAVSQITDEELNIYNQYPETFFGVHKEECRRLEEYVDVLDFLYETYKDTPKDMLLGFLKSKHLEHLSQNELAIKYCENVASVLTRK